MGKGRGCFFRYTPYCLSKPRSCHRGVELQGALAESANDLRGPVQGDLVKSPHSVVTGIS